MRATTKILLVVGAILAVSLTALPVVSAQPVAVEKSSKNCMAGHWFDQDGNDYKIKGSSTACGAPYSFKGSLYSSPYLEGLPWKVTGTGAYDGFTLVIHASATAIADGDCSGTAMGILSGSPPSQTATGIWYNIGCGGNGTFTFNQTSAGPVITSISGGRLGVPSKDAGPSGISMRSKSCMAGVWQETQGGNNVYSIGGKSITCGTAYKFKGVLNSSTYLAGLPWKVTGTGAYDGFTWVSHVSSGGLSAGDGSWTVMAILTGSPPDQTSSGIWYNLDFAGYGTFAATQTAGGPVMIYTGDPGGIPA